MMECKSYKRDKDIAENKELFIIESEHIKTKKMDNDILIGCELDDFYEIDKLFYF